MKLFPAAKKRPHGTLGELGAMISDHMIDSFIARKLPGRFGKDLLKSILHCIRNDDGYLRAGFVIPSAIGVLLVIVGMIPVNDPSGAYFSAVGWSFLALVASCFTVSGLVHMAKNEVRASALRGEITSSPERAKECLVSFFDLVYERNKDLLLGESSLLTKRTAELESTKAEVDQLHSYFKARAAQGSGSFKKEIELLEAKLDSLKQAEELIGRFKSEAIETLNWFKTDLDLVKGRANDYETYARMERVCGNVDSLVATTIADIRSMAERLKGGMQMMGQILCRIEQNALLIKAANTDSERLPEVGGELFEVNRKLELIESGADVPTDLEENISFKTETSCARA